MVYGYKTNREFIDKTQILLNKLEKRGIWDKDTLVIGLDKSVRPLAYTIRKLSKEEGKETPDIRFFNYNTRKDVGTFEEISNELKRRQNPKKFEKYKKIIILDEHLITGKSLEDSKKIFEYYFANSKNHPEINLVALGPAEKLNRFNKNNFIFLENELIGPSDVIYNGILDKHNEFFRNKDNIIQESEVVEYNNKHFNYRGQFIQNRKQLSKAINKYIQEKQAYNEDLPVRRSLERAVQMVSVVAFFGGIILSYKSITGNVIGGANSTNILSIVLIILGLLGLIIFRKVKR